MLAHLEHSLSRILRDATEFFRQSLRRPNDVVVPPEVLEATTVV